MIGIGAGLGHYTTEGGYLYPGAKVVQIDISRAGLWQGLRTADLHVQADASAAAEAITPAQGSVASAARAGAATRSPEDRRDHRAGPKEFTTAPGTVDPRKAILELDAAVPKDWDIIIAGGHCFSFAMTHMRGRPAGSTMCRSISARSARAAGGDRRRRGARDGKVC